MRVGNTPLLQKSQNTKSISSPVEPNEPTEASLQRDKYVPKAGRRSTSKKEEGGFGLMKAFTLANLALAGGFGGITRAAAQPYPPVGTCPNGMSLQASHHVEIPLNIGDNWAWGPCDSPGFLQEFANPPYSTMALANCRAIASENGARVGLMGFCDNIVFRKCDQNVVNVWLGYVANLWFCQPDR